MESVTHISETHPLDDRWKAALLTLLGDEDPTVYEATRDEIVAHGMEARDWLEGSLDDVRGLARRRSREIVRFFYQQNADNDFTSFCLGAGDQLDLEHASWLLASTSFPEINIEAYSAWLDMFAGELLDRIDYGAEPMAIFSVINRYLFDDLKFRSAAAGMRLPEHYFLNRVLEEREGNSAGLSLFYTFLSLRLHLPVSLIYLPGYFLCRFQTSREEFFIDPCQKGRFLSKHACNRYLQHDGYSPYHQHLIPQSPRKAMIQICQELRRVSSENDDTEQSSRMQRYILALSG